MRVLFLMFVFLVLEGCSNGDKEKKIGEDGNTCEPFVIGSIDDAEKTSSDESGYHCGDVTITGEGLLSAPYLVTIDGDLKIDSGPGLPILCDLVIVTGDVYVSVSDASLAAGMLSNVRYIGGQIFISDYKWITEIDMPNIDGFDYSEDVVFLQDR